MTFTEEEVQKDPAVLKISPRRVLPVLALPNGEMVVEAGAIALYFLEEYDKEGKLHPLPGSPNRIRFLQAVVYSVAEAYSAVVNLFKVCRGVPVDKRDRAVIDPLIEKYEKVVVQHLERELDFGKRDYYLGDEFSAADIMFSYITMVATFVEGEKLLENAVVAAYAKRVADRDAYKTLYIPPSA